MPAPGSPEWYARRDDLLVQEASQPEQWWYLSFVVGETFAGAAIVRARGMTSAVQEAHRLGVNPGGQVMAFPVGNEMPSLPTNRLLSKDELGPGAKSVGELESEGRLPGSNMESRD